MSHLLAPQEEKKTTRDTQSEPTVSDPSFLVPPQEQQSGNLKGATGQSWLVPPQEEKVDTAGLRGEQSRLDQAIGRMENQVNKRRIEQDAPGSVNERAQDKQQRDAVLSGAAGITGEDLGVAENQRLV